jgi:hypothetical protein
MKRAVALLLSLLAVAGCSIPTAPSADKAAKAKATLEGASKVSHKLATN